MCPRSCTNEPQTTSVVYSPPLLVLSLLLATVAGVLAVRVWRGWPRRRAGRAAKSAS